MATVSFKSQDEMLAAIYDASDLLVSVFEQTNAVSDLYEDCNLDDLTRAVAVLKEVMDLIAEGDI